jgi:hypothetical protein
MIVFAALAAILIVAVFTVKEFFNSGVRS